MPNTLENYLEAPDGAGKILAHARLLMRLSALYQQIAPAYLADASHLANYKSGIVVVHADNGTIAAKLRQLGPTLADGFSRRGIECNGVQVRVQGDKIAHQSITSTPKPLTENTCDELRALHDNLPEGPLRTALDTLLDRALKAQ